MGSRTGPGNISWYKGNLKKGTIKMEDYLDAGVKLIPVVQEVKPISDEIPLPAELIVTEEDIIKATGMQKVALEFHKSRSERDFNVLYARLKPGMFFHAMGLLKDE